MRYYVYLDTSMPPRWRWTLFAANNRKIANSGEAYNNLDDCLAAIELVATSARASVLFSEAAERRRARLVQLRRSRRAGL